MSESKGPVTRWLARVDSRVLNLYAVTAAFVTYFCMYAFRKPFAAATYEGPGLAVLDHEISQKTLYVISQILGYAISKYLGVKFCSEVGRNKRFVLLVSLICAAEAALVLFAIAPQSPVIKAVAIFANGLPLGMVWGLVVLYLEGRKTSEVLLTWLSCSYIVASGIVKDVGRALLHGVDFPLPVPEGWGLSIANPLPALPDFWMPAATGVIFLPLFLLAAWLLEQIPDPDEQDKAERTERVPMGQRERQAFVRTYVLAVFVAMATFFLLTAFRDYRDNYSVEVFTQLGYAYDVEKNQTIISKSELPVGIGVAIVLSKLYWFRNNRWGLIATYVVMISGLVLMGTATLLLDFAIISGFVWFMLIGIGAYLAYVPFGAVLFDRVIACTRFTGTAVFGIYLADAIGYTGSVILQLGKDFLLAGSSQLYFLRMLSYLLAIFGSIGLMISCFSFLRQRRGNNTLAVHANVSPSGDRELVKEM